MAGGGFIITGVLIRFGPLLRLLGFVLASESWALVCDSLSDSLVWGSESWALVHDSLSDSLVLGIMGPCVRFLIIFVSLGFRVLGPG